MPAASNIQPHCSISKTELAALPAASFKGKITVIDSSEAISASVEKLYAAHVVGFDTETRPSFQKGQTNLVSLIQLSTKDECFLFRLNKIGFHPLIISLLEDSKITKIGVSVHDDFLNLRKLADFNPCGFVELQNEVGAYGIADKSLSRIYALLFGERISKGQRLSNWEAPTLTGHQKGYAALDAAACLRIYNHLRSGGFNADQCKYHLPETELSQNEE